MRVKIATLFTLIPTRISFAVFFALALLGSAAVPTPASATVFPVVGSRGDAGATDQCPSGTYVVGFHVRGGAWLDQIAVVCGSWSQSSLSWSNETIFQGRGGSGGAPLPEAGTTCSPEELVDNINIYLDDGGKQVNRIDIYCYSVKFGKDETVYIRPPGLADGVPAAGQHCPTGEIATGLNIRYGKDVNGLGLICGPYVPPAAAVANAQQAPVVSNAGKPIKTTGGAGTFAPDKDLVCQGGGGMTVTPVPNDASTDYVSFAQASTASPAAGQCAWTTGPIGGAFNKLILTTKQPMAQQLLQAAQNGGSFTGKGRTLGGGIIMVTGVESAQPTSGGGTATATSSAGSPAAGSGYVLVCQGGGDMHVSGGGVTLGGPSYAIVSFDAAPQGASAAPPGPGTCAWTDRALRAGEPLTLQIPNDLPGGDKLKQAIDGGTFQVHANTVGKALVVNQVDDAKPSQGGAATATDNTGNGASTSGGGSALQPPIAEDTGPATIAKAVNVHTSANGKTVIGSLPAGTGVTSLGCSGGWCHVSFSGGQGYVAQSFLSFQ